MIDKVYYQLDYLKAILVIDELIIADKCYGAGKFSMCLTIFFL